MEKNTHIEVLWVDKDGAIPPSLRMFITQAEPNSHVAAALLILPASVMRKLAATEGLSNGVAPFFRNTPQNGTAQSSAVASLCQKNILGVVDIVYCTRNRIVEIRNWQNSFHLQCAIRKIKEKIARVCIWAFPKTKEEIHAVVECGLTVPLFCKSRPLTQEKTSADVFALIGESGKPPLFSFLEVVRYLRMRRQDNSISACRVNFRFGQYMLNLLRKKVLENEEEISGEFAVSAVDQDGTLVLDRIDHMQDGGKEHVDAVATRFSFHTHPQAAYLRHNVQKAWPSGKDYASISQLGERMVFHVVATVEGLYIVSRIATPPKNLPQIAREYNISLHLALTPLQYTEQINKNPERLFRVAFFPWEHASNTITVAYPRDRKGCIALQPAFEYAEQLERLCQVSRCCRNVLL